MVTYNPKDWYKLIFGFHRSDTFRMLLPAIIGVGVYTAIIAYLHHDLQVLHFKGTMAVHSLLGFVISMLLVFRTNTAYERWWEGRKQWGDLVNNSRNLALKINVFVAVDYLENKKSIRDLIINYVFVLKEHLRNNYKPNELTPHVAIDLNQLAQKDHKPVFISQHIYTEVNNLYKQEKLSAEQFLFLNEELRSFMNIAGACERIRSSPIPYSYSIFIKKFIFMYVITLPFAFVAEFHYWSVLISIFVFYAFTSLELIAEEIEDPFGDDSNDLPLDDIASKIKNNLNEIIK